MTKAKMKPFTKTKLEAFLGVAVVYALDGDHRKVITVCQKYGNSKVWQHPIIYRYHSSGNECSIEKTEQFIAALRDAIREAKRLDKRTGTKVQL